MRVPSQFIKVVLTALGTKGDFVYVTEKCRFVWNISPDSLLKIHRHTRVRMAKDPPGELYCLGGHFKERKLIKVIKTDHQIKMGHLINTPGPRTD